MLRNFFSSCLLILFGTLVTNAQAIENSLVLVAGGTSDYTIIYPAKNLQDEKKAALVLQHYLKLITGIQLKIFSDTIGIAENEIVLGSTNRAVTDLSKLTIDGFFINAEGPGIYIAGKGEKGTLYGVYDFLELLGCRMYATGYKIIPKKEILKVEVFFKIDNPVFNFRSVYYPDAEKDDEYLDWHRLHRIEQKWGLWGHTFNTLVPPELYFKYHPEYFAEVNGSRQTSQLCLTNPEVLKVVLSSLEKRISDEPDKKFWSVSQNDGSGYCECINCARLNNMHNSPQGSIISFLNSIASHFPDKTFTTLAYGYSKSAPTGLRPLKNVCILLSDIELNRAAPMEFDSGAASFRNDLKNWSSLTGNIIVWDYVVQFTNYLSPFPNQHILQPNLNFMAERQIEGVFEQGSVEVQGEFSQLKSYMLAKLLWNPGQNAADIKREFLIAWYGRAATLVERYQNLLQQGLKEGGRLDIYGDPIKQSKFFLAPELLKTYSSTIDRALKKVSKNSPEYKHVLAIKLGLDFAKLQQAKYFGIERYGIFTRVGNNWVLKPGFKQRVENFVSSSQMMGIDQLDESGTSLAQYSEEWQEILAMGPKIHQGIGKPIKALTAFYQDYATKGIATLTDGAPGYKDLSFNWLEWAGKDMIVVLDMEKSTEIKQISVSFLEQQRHLMFFPSSVEFAVSEDGKQFKTIGLQNNGEPLETENISIRTNEIRPTGVVRARFIKITASCITELPPWKQSRKGNPSILADEILIN